MKAMGVKPTERLASNSIMYGNIDPDTGLLHDQREEEEEPEEVVRMPDFKHKELEGGDWQCGYCGNINLAARKQIEKCNMRSCGKDHYLNSGKVYTMMTPAMAAKEAREAKEKLDNQHEARKKAGEKRPSLYANQNGGMAANPMGLKKKKKN